LALPWRFVGNITLAGYAALRISDLPRGLIPMALMITAGFAFWFPPLSNAAFNIFGIHYSSLPGPNEGFPRRTTKLFSAAAFHAGVCRSFLLGQQIVRGSNVALCASTHERSSRVATSCFRPLGFTREVTLYPASSMNWPRMI
jgi:hypothetical protein